MAKKLGCKVFRKTGSCPLIDYIAYLPVWCVEGSGRFCIVDGNVVYIPLY